MKALTANQFKVMNYLEWMLSDGNYSEDLYIQLLQNDQWTNRDVAEWYNQKFQPELIEKYFEGWEKHKTFVNTYNYSYQNKYLIKEASGIYSMLMNYKSIEDCIVLTTLYPETLNDFIRDCQRAGIELTYKIKVRDEC